jgi:hypothetical protein
MTSPRALRLAVIVWFVLLAAMFGVGTADDQALPAEVSDWLQAQKTPWLAFGAMAFALIGSVTGSIGLLVGKRWGAWVHLLSNLTGTAAGAFAATHITSAATMTIDSLFETVSGLIYGLAFFTDALAPRNQAYNQAPLLTPANLTPAARAPVVPPSGVAGR